MKYRIRVELENRNKSRLWKKMNICHSVFRSKLKRKNADVIVLGLKLALNAFKFKENQDLNSGLVQYLYVLNSLVPRLWILYLVGRTNEWVGNTLGLRQTSALHSRELLNV